MIKLNCEKCNGETKVLHSEDPSAFMDMGAPVYCCEKCKLANRIINFDPLKFVREEWILYEKYFHKTISPVDTWSDFEKKIANAFYEEWKDELGDVNYLDGIMFTIEYLRKKGMLNDSK